MLKQDDKKKKGFLKGISTLLRYVNFNSFFLDGYELRNKVKISHITPQDIVAYQIILLCDLNCAVTLYCRVEG